MNALIMLTVLLAAPGDDLTVKEAELAQLESDIASAPAPTDPTSAMWRASAVMDAKILRTMLFNNAWHLESLGYAYNPYYTVARLPYGGPYTHAIVVDPIHNMLCAGQQHLNASLLSYPHPMQTWSHLGTPPGYFKVLVPIP